MLSIPPLLFSGLVVALRKSRVLILGHSIVYWAGKYASESGWGADLGLGDNICINWSGHRGLRWPALLETAASEVYRFGTPSLLILQLGENDLPGTTGRNLLQSIVADLTTLQLRLPDTLIAWSCLLERLNWRGAAAPEKVDLARRRVCKGAARFITSYSGLVIRHPDITHRIPALYRTDGVHLSDWGTDVWLQDIRGALLQWSQA